MPRWGIDPVADELLILPSLLAWQGETGRLVVTRKFLTGAAAFARHWPGPVTSLLQKGKGPTTDLDPVEVGQGEGQTGVEIRPTEPAALRARLSRAGAALCLLSRAEVPTLHLCREIGVPVIFISEYSPLTERQILDSETGNPLLRLRRRLWLWRTERKRRAILPLAAGLQCSGTPTWLAYQGLCRDTILFFDNRVRAADVANDDVLADKAARLRRREPLRLVFGGRFVAMKGVMDLPRVAVSLRRLGVPFSFDVVGDGPLAGPLRARIAEAGLGEAMRVLGPQDFATGWLPHLRQNADLFVCGHPQGDPSSTYPEVMSCGVPIAGYDNEAFRGVVDKSGSGWLAPMHDAEALARTIAGLHADREALVAAGRRARDFGAACSFEVTYRARAHHLIRVSRLPEHLKQAALAA
jgi:glycosyltransferase involved in cell wall biosynthesis